MRYIYFLRAIHCRCQVGNKIDLQQAVSSAEHSNAVSNCGLELQARTSATRGSAGSALTGNKASTTSSSNSRNNRSGRPNSLSRSSSVSGGLSRSSSHRNLGSPYKNKSSKYYHMAGSEHMSGVTMATLQTSSSIAAPVTP